jgi:hypothetical protein
MAIASGKAHSTWVELKKKEGKQGTKNVDKLFQKKLGPTLDDFDKACKAGKVDDATKLKDKIAEILKGYLKISESLKL